MGYQIQYGQTMAKTVIPNPKERKKITPVIILICSFLLAFILWGRAEEVRDFLIPGNKAVTEAALSTMVDNIREGEALGDAITAFCKEIIENANISK